MTAAQALGCQSCGLPISPCLVCADPIPVCPDESLITKACCNCGVVNPLGDKHRNLLGIPPILALPSAMVRRAQIAHVGRRPYILAKHAHYMHLKSLLDKEDDKEGDGVSESHTLASGGGPRGPPVPEIFASAAEGHPLTFLPYMQERGVRLNGEDACVGRMAADKRYYYTFSDSESPAKRMRFTIFPGHRERDCVERNSGRYMHSTLHQAQENSSPANPGAAVPNGLMPNIRTDIEHNLDKPADIQEATDILATASKRIPEPLVVGFHCSPYKTRCEDEPENELRTSVDDSDVGGARCCGTEGETILNGVDVSSDHPQSGSKAHQRDTSSTEPYLPLFRSIGGELDESKDILKSECPVIERPLCSSQAAQHYEGGEARTSGGTVSGGSEEQPHKYFEHDFYPPSNVEESSKLPYVGGEEVDTASENDSLEGEDHNHVRDMTGSEEVPIHRHLRFCPCCGQAGEESETFNSKVDDADLLRCCTQILELRCPHALRADLYSTSVYPLCCPTSRYPLPGSALPLSKGCQSLTTQFTIDSLRMAHSTLTSSSQESTSEEVKSPHRCVELALSMAERLIKIKDRMDNVHKLKQKVDAASSQAARDLRAFTDRGACPLSSQLIPRLLNKQKQELVNQGKSDTEEMSTFLQEINKVLTTCYQHVGKILEMSSAIGDSQGDIDNLSFSILDVETKSAAEAVRTAVPLWLRLYHDAAHASWILK